MSTLGQPCQVPDKLCPGSYISCGTDQLCGGANAYVASQYTDPSYITPDIVAGHCMSGKTYGGWSTAVRCTAPSIPWTPSPTPIPGSHAPSKTTITAAIVGGTLGAVAILALLLTWYLRRRRLDGARLASSGRKMDPSGVLDSGFPSSPVAGFSTAVPEMQTFNQGKTEQNTNVGMPATQISPPPEGSATLPVDLPTRGLTTDQANFIAGLYRQGVPTSDVALIVESLRRGTDGSSTRGTAEANSPPVQPPPEYDFKAP